jgi:two-component system cell cycle response regulator
MAEEKILVIEDNELNMKLVRTLLEIGQYKVIEASNAEMGIDLAKKYVPDLILMDIQLPGMDGLSATKKIKNDPDLNHIPVIALTSYAMEDDYEKARNAGCSFYITKPIDTKSFLKTINDFFNKESHGKHSQEKKKIKYKPKILVVDDVPENVKLLAACLTSEEYEIYKAYNGEEALEQVQATLPDLILLDIMMPGIDGYEVTRRLKNNPETKHIPIILVTALDGSDNKAKGMEAGADEYLTKPVNMTELLARVKSMLRLGQYREQLAIRKVSEQPFGGKMQLEQPLEEVTWSQRVLLVEDDEKDAKLIKDVLETETYDLIHVSTGEEAISVALSQKIDLILLDIFLPGIDGFEVCARIKDIKETNDIQVVIITCMDDLESKIRGVELGADDYLIKPINKREIRARVKALLRKKGYIDELHSHYDMAMDSAINDGLTGLYNHVYFKHFLGMEVKKSLRQGYPVALIMLDIDDFKKYNDKLGHITGDVILRELANVVRENVREIDLPARYGGEEFALVLPYAGKDGALSGSKRIMKAISSHKFLHETTSSIEKLTVSIGIACCPEDSYTEEDLIQKADSVLYQAKKEGKNKVCIFSEDQQVQIIADTG